MYGQHFSSTCNATLQVEKRCCTYYHPPRTLSRNKILLKKFVGKSRRQFNLLQHAASTYNNKILLRDNAWGGSYYINLSHRYSVMILVRVYHHTISVLHFLERNKCAFLLLVDLIILLLCVDPRHEWRWARASKVTLSGSDSSFLPVFYTSTGACRSKQREQPLATTPSAFFLSLHATDSRIAIGKLLLW